MFDCPWFTMLAGYIYIMYAYSMVLVAIINYLSRINVMKTYTTGFSSLQFKIEFFYEKILVSAQTQCTRVFFV